LIYVTASSLPESILPAYFTYIQGKQQQIFIHCCMTTAIS